jgi:hypothetical protein
MADPSKKSRWISNNLLSNDVNAREVSQDLAKFVYPRIYVGDIDADGFPDILVTISYQNSSSIP